MGPSCEFFRVGQSRKNGWDTWTRTKIKRSRGARPAIRRYPITFEPSGSACTRLDAPLEATLKILERFGSVNQKSADQTGALHPPDMTHAVW